MTTTLFLLFQKPGPSWVPGRPTREQPLWEDHAAFVDLLFQDGRIVMAGPYADFSRALVVVKAKDIEEVRTLFQQDPWAINGILISDNIVEWTVYLDSHRTT